MIAKSEKMIKGLIFTSLISTSVYALEISSGTQAVNVAGKQRMFTQRMLKDYAMIGMKNTFGNPTEDLKKIVDEFDTANVALLAFTKNDEIKKNIETMEDAWKPIKEILLNEAKKEKVVKLQENLELLLKKADEITKLFAKTSGKESGEIVNLAGRQRMLSQRMAGLYMIKVWGINDPQFKDKLTDAMQLFKTSQNTLEKSTLNTSEITALLAKVKRSFIFFEMMSKSKSKFVPTLIYKKSNDMLKNMNSATQAYVALENK